jgi:hypothetical protein
MNYYAGIDVTLEDSCICVIDADGKVLREGKVSSEPTALIAWLSEVGVTLTRIGPSEIKSSRPQSKRPRDYGPRRLEKCIRHFGDGLRPRWPESQSPSRRGRGRQGNGEGIAAQDHEGDEPSDWPAHNAHQRVS